MMSLSVKVCPQSHTGRDVSCSSRSATDRSYSQLNWNVSKTGRNTASQMVVRNVSENSNDSGNCWSVCHTQSRNNRNIGDLSACLV